MFKKTIPSTAVLTPPKFENLEDRDILLRNSAFDAASVSKNFTDSSVVDGIMEHFVVLRTAVEEARERCDIHTIAWIRDSVFAWQSLMTNVLRVPCNVRERVGIQPEDNYYDRVDAMDLLQRQAHQIADKRKLKRKLEEASYFLRYPERINDEIASSHEECLEDWHQSSLFLALDLLQGRLHTSILADSRVASVLNDTFLEEVIQLKAYLLWEASRVGFSASHAEQFYSSACDQLTAFLRPAPINDTFLRQLTLQRVCEWKEYPRQHVDRRESRISFKAQWIAQRHCHPLEYATSIAKRQVELFEGNIVSALKGDEDAIKLVNSSVMPNGDPKLATCSTVLECLTAVHCHSIAASYV